jgi:hypothetical protein
MLLHSLVLLCFVLQRWRTRMTLAYAQRWCMRQKSVRNLLPHAVMLLCSVLQRWRTRMT